MQREPAAVLLRGVPAHADRGPLPLPPLAVERERLERLRRPRHRVDAGRDRLPLAEVTVREELVPGDLGAPHPHSGALDPEPSRTTRRRRGSSRRSRAAERSDRRSDRHTRATTAERGSRSIGTHRAAARAATLRLPPMFDRLPALCLLTMAACAVAPEPAPLEVSETLAMPIRFVREPGCVHVFADAEWFAQFHVSSVDKPFLNPILGPTGGPRDAGLAADRGRAERDARPRPPQRRVVLTRRRERARLLAQRPRTRADLPGRVPEARRGDADDHLAPRVDRRAARRAAAGAADDALRGERTRPGRRLHDPAEGPRAGR